MEINLDIRDHLSAEEEKELLVLWNEEYPTLIHFDALENFQQYLQRLVAIKHYLLKTSGGSIQGWAFCFDRENERWFAILLSADIQGRGYGKMLINCIKRDERSLTAWVIDKNQYQKKNGKTYTSPLPFYLKNGFKIFPEEKPKDSSLEVVKIRWTTE